MCRGWCAMISFRASNAKIDNWAHSNPQDFASSTPGAIRACRGRHRVFHSPSLLIGWHLSLGVS